MRRSSGAYIVLRVHLESIGNSAQATSKRFPFGQPAFHRRRVWSLDQDRMRVSSFVSRVPFGSAAPALDKVRMVEETFELPLQFTSHPNSRSALVVRF
jgi:hypothetical protein